MPGRLTRKPGKEGRQGAGKRRSPTVFPKECISIHDFERGHLVKVLARAKANAKATPAAKLSRLRGKTIANLFFEPSTRTRLSFEAAAQNLGANVIGFSDANVTSLKKGESLADTIRMVSAYADALVIRHWREGSAALARMVSDKVIVNAGDGANEHPTQNLIDVYTIQQRFGKLTGLTIGFLGDLRYARTVKGLVHALSLLGNNRFYFISPKALRMHPMLVRGLEESAGHIEQSDHLNDLLPALDVLYVTRIQKERFDSEAAWKKASNSYRVDASLMAKAKGRLAVMHPLPRVNEVAVDLDDSPHALYFRQAANGLPVREALLELLLRG